MQLPVGYGHRVPGQFVLIALHLARYRTSTTMVALQLGPFGVQSKLAKQSRIFIAHCRSSVRTIAGGIAPRQDSHDQRVNVSERSALYQWPWSVPACHHLRSINDRLRQSRLQRERGSLGDGLRAQPIAQGDGRGRVLVES